MRSDSKSLLLSHLVALKEHGTTGSMLFMTVQGTSDILLAGIRNGCIQLDFAVSGLFDLTRPRNFKAFCKARSYCMTQERWGKERIHRAALGDEPLAAVEAIDDCFRAVYGHEGEFSVDFSAVGWLPFNKPLHPTAFGVG